MCVLRVLERRGKRNVKTEALRLQLAAGLARLVRSCGVRSTSRQPVKILQIPFALAVTHQHEKTFAHSSLLFL